MDGGFLASPVGPAFDDQLAGGRGESSLTYWTRRGSAVIGSHSSAVRRRGSARLSQFAFVRVASAALTRMLPVAWNTASNEAVKFEMRSQIRNLSWSSR